MADEIFLATDRGVVIGQRQHGRWQATSRSLEERQVKSLIAREGVVLAGTTEGIFRSDDRGHSWRAASAGLTTPHVRWLAFHPDVSDLELAGTEPAGIFVSQDGARNWAERPEVGALRDKNGWFLPYSPEAGCIRGFAIHGNRLYAAAEVGGLLVSVDQGLTWQLAEGSDGQPRWGRPPGAMIHPDVHSVAVHVSSPDLVYAPTGGGFYLSTDGGQTWRLAYKACYCRAVWIDPADPEHLLLGVADSVDRGGRIEESLDGGESWQGVNDGLQTPWPRTMVERFVGMDDLLFAILSDGRLYSSPIGHWSWQQVLDDVPAIRALTAMA